MRELNIGGTEVRVRATPLALLFYKQEFKRDLLGDLIKLVKDMMPSGDVKVASEEELASTIDASQFDSLILLQLIWAMAKADSYGKKSFPSFSEWLASLDYIDLSDKSLFMPALEEAAQGFFRSAAGQSKVFR